jgi:cell division cycle 2-like protein
VAFPQQKFNNLRTNFPAVSVSGGPTLSDLGFDLLNKLLTYDPEARISAQDALDHPWFEEHPLPKAKEMMPTYPTRKDGTKARDRRKFKSPDPLAELKR